VNPRPRPPAGGAGMKLKRTLRAASAFGAVFCVLAAMAVLSFALTTPVYGRTGQPPAWLAQVINTLLGFFFLGLILFFVGRFFQNKQIDWFNPIIAAMDRIAKGDFSTRLDEHQQADGVLGELVRSVNKMAGELNQTEQMRQEFVSNVSHEIQSPLTSIRGFARALREEDLSLETRQHYLGIIETESMRLSKLSDNLLELASLDSEQLKLDPKPYRLDRQIRGLILACEPQWTDKGLELDAALDEATVVTADEDLLSQVWINLIHNSIKFTPAGGCVRVALKRQADGVQVTVADTGPGIAPADQAHIFERFYKADKARRRSEGGNGLGLSIVKKIVELHHGTVRVDSQPGQGATFTVALPAVQP
jgi:two-component system, OmpR family, phosphate regulon sensor histidine kinase PhoR